MAYLSARRNGFLVSEIYRLRRPSFIVAARQRLSFVIATLSLVAFVVGNMVGQHGWYAFWRTVFGQEEVILFTGTVSPIAEVPDFERWARYGGDIQRHTYRQVPADVLVPLPPYDARALRDGTTSALAERIYSVGNLGDYRTGRDHAGSHVGVDIAVPLGTPVLSVANGIVERVSTQSDGYGHHIVVRHPNVPDPRSSGGMTTLWSVYAHLDALLVREGQVVLKGQQIATSGQTGFASGPHLHFQIDNADAPFHPYWPFTGQEQREAGYTFTQAINAGLHQERGIAYTESPLLFTQAYASYVAPRSTVADTGSVQHAAAPVRRMTLAERVAARRLSRLSAQPVSVTSLDAPVVSFSSVSSSSSSSVASSQQTVEPSSTKTVAEIPSPLLPSDGSSTDVSSLTFHHSGRMTRSWQRVEILALDRNNHLVKTPVFSGRVYLRTDFGTAEIRPAEISSLDFVDGVATVQVLTRGTKTTILSARGAFNVDSAPLVYER